MYQCNKRSAENQAIKMNRYQVLQEGNKTKTWWEPKGMDKSDMKTKSDTCL